MLTEQPMGLLLVNEAFELLCQYWHSFPSRMDVPYCTLLLTALRHM